MAKANVETTPTVPVWSAQGKIRKSIAPQSTEYASGGEVVRISPRFRQEGHTFRVRPERPAAFFALYCVDNNILPSSITAEDALTEPYLEVLAPLFEACKGYFEGIEPAITGGDAKALPNLREGFSFLVPQVLVERIGFAQDGTSSPVMSKPVVNPVLIDSIAKKVAEMKAKQVAVKPEPKPEVKPEGKPEGKKK